jgi:hypothetical protein
VLAAHREEAVFHLVEDLRLRAGDLRLDGVVLGVLSEVAVDVAVDRSADGVDDVGAVRLVLVFRLLDELRELPRYLFELPKVLAEVRPPHGGFPEFV